MATTAAGNDLQTEEFLTTNYDSCFIHYGCRIHSVDWHDRGKHKMETFHKGGIFGVGYVIVNSTLMCT